MNLPIELINKILIMRPTHPTAKLIKQMFVDTNKHIDEWFSFSRQSDFNNKLIPRTPDLFVHNDFHRFYFHYNKFGLYSNTQKFYRFKIKDFC